MFSLYPPNFNVYSNRPYIIIRPKPNTFSYIHVFLDELKLKTFGTDDDIYLRKDKLPKGAHILRLIGENKITQYEEETFYSIDVAREKLVREPQKHDYKTGDIIVASDNKKGIPDGYMGHSALIIDEKYMLESDYSADSIAINSINSFFKDHEWYALYRPLDEKMGQQAVEWGLSYYEKYQENLKKGINRPVFSFIPSSMKDLWNAIYCSKLIWVCYYYGANYKFEHDGLWFSPQNLDEQLKKDKNFTLIYEHPDHSFKIKF
ncbi:uncharacterized protein YycO [Evansella vedderi]|uniref:Uncharacterized protein YycO n=1 Tax=Evansella vedderi TaxID=38282 RepID=A0ABT9ZYJ7_9BACI|nr:peptidoglycan amidohydrolase family protein [Evansella vedderi]MDQ0255807.1 uncharacterized protein YycO [Evansella vedderi]